MSDPPNDRPGYAPIGDYALIGDTRAAALVSLDGSIDWLCLPRFDSPSVFAAILDEGRGGRFRIAPADPFTSRRRYLPDTNLLDTTFDTDSGQVIVRDLMTLSPAGSGRLAPDHEVLREVECLRGSVEMDVRFEPRPDYGRASMRLEDRGALGIRWADDANSLSLLGDVRLCLDAAATSAGGRFLLRAGERRGFSLASDIEAPAVLPAPGRIARDRIEQTAAWWRSWADRCTYRGPYREAVVRSALALKLLAFAPSGAMVAAPTTSLPEEIGGERNWDYRFCWLRDATFLMRALHEIGYMSLGDAFFAWMLQATRLTHPELHVVYDLFGGTRLTERELSHFEGFRGSRPVRVGNGASTQFQLDVYGEVIDAADRFTSAGGELDGDEVAMLEGFADTVCRRWQEPDDGIWESRGKRQHYVHSKVLCWVALDRMVRMHARGHLRTDADRFRRHRDDAREAIERHGFDRRLGTYVRVFGGQEVDSSLLTLPLLDYVAADDPRMRATFERITHELADGAHYRRYRAGTDDGVSGGEGAFGICSFWAVECRAMAGDLDGAVRSFETLLGCANDVGLYAEETDPATGALLGNFPQALTHVGLINAAVTIERERERR